MLIISISGLDGSGKSTQINLLKEYLEKKGKKVFYFHATAFSIANKHKDQETTNKKQETRSVTKANWLQIQLRKIALFIDLFRFKSFTKKLSAQDYDYLLSDRYFYDSIINIAYLSCKNDSCSMLHAPCFMEIPTPDFAFYLNTDPESIMQRDRVPDQGLQYLQKKKELLDLFSKENNLIEINGNQEKEKILQQIKEKTSL